MKSKKPKCKYCWDKGYSTQLVNVHEYKDLGMPNRGKMLERKIYCTKCNKGKRLKRNANK